VPSQDEMLAHVMLRKADGGSIDMKTIGAEEAPNMDVKTYVAPSGGQGLPVGGVDFQPESPGKQLMPGAPNQPPGQLPGLPGQVPQQPSPLTGQPPPSLNGAQAPALNQPNQMLGGPPMPPFGQPRGPQSNILAMTPQGQAMQAMRPSPTPMPRMASGGSTTPSVEEMRKALANKIKISKTSPRTWAGTGFGDKGASYGIESHPHLMVIRESHGWTARDPNTKQKWFGEDKNELENELNNHFDSNKMKRGGSTHDIQMTERPL